MGDVKRSTIAVLPANVSIGLSTTRCASHLSPAEWTWIEEGGQAETVAVVCVLILLLTSSLLKCIHLDWLYTTAAKELLHTELSMWS